MSNQASFDDDHLIKLRRYVSDYQKDAENYSKVKGLYESALSDDLFRKQDAARPVYERMQPHFWERVDLQRRLNPPPTLEDVGVSEAKCESSRQVLATYLRQECWPLLHERLSSLTSLDDQQLFILRKRIDWGSELDKPRVEMRDETSKPKEGTYRDHRYEGALQYCTQVDQEVVAVLETRRAMPKALPAPTPQQIARKKVEAVGVQVQSGVELEVLLELQRDELKKKFPDKAKQIDLKYRLILDQLREEI